MTRLARVVVEAVIIGIVALLVAAMHAEAAVHVRVAADAPQGPVLSTNAYTVTVTTDEAVTLKTVRLLLPGHGAPPISEDVYGQPRDTDDDTQFTVLDAHGATQAGRWLTWDAPETLLPGGVLSFRADVRLPQAEAFFQAGATATINGGASDERRGLLALRRDRYPKRGYVAVRQLRRYGLRDGTAGNGVLRAWRRHDQALDGRMVRDLRPAAGPVGVDATKRGATINGGASDAAREHLPARGIPGGAREARGVRPQAPPVHWLSPLLAQGPQLESVRRLRYERTRRTLVAALSVDATKRGAQIWAHQDTASLHTGGTATIDGRVVTVTWWMANGTTTPLTIDTERFGVRAGAAYEGSTLDPVFKVRHVSSLGIIWHHAITLAAGERVEHTVTLTSPCGVGMVGARLRIYAGTTLAGTGDAGPHWKLPDCGGAS